MCFSQYTLAGVKLPAVDDQFVNVKLKDPVRDAGYMVGGVLTRTVTLTVKKPYQLVKESVPIVGYQHRYKGQVSGIELVKINMKLDETDQAEIHTMNLSYQVFTTSRVAKPATLRAEVFKIRNTKTKKIFQFKIPSFPFRISPLSVYGQVNLNQEMYPFTAPLTIDNSKKIFNVKVLASIFSLALLGLLYIFGTRAWLPRMGAPFAKAYRDIKKLPDSTEGLQQAVERVHLSLNKTAGASLFSNNLDAFITRQPKFAPAKQEIEKFFALSQEVFFEGEAHIAIDDPKTWLLQLCRQLRHCERGLIPDLTAESNNA